jgi:sugar phosphate isomerase/epimerase
VVTPLRWPFFRTLHKIGYDKWLTIEVFGLKVPGLVRPLHLWRPFFDKEDDVAVMGLKYIRESWDGSKT